MKHKTKHPLYTTWSGMHQRCRDPNYTKWEYYGGKGIRVCSRWSGKDGFDHFVEDMGVRPPGTTLDRIDSSKDYQPDNCQWSTWHHQRLNQKRPPVPEHCTIPGCDAPTEARGWCVKHYTRWRRTGDPEGIRVRAV